MIEEHNKKFAYDIALSYAGEDREYAEAIAEILRANSVKVFYDKYEKNNLWGKVLYTHLSTLYKKRARYCVMLLSKHYAEKLWTNHEREAAQARAFTEHEEYILPVRLDKTEIPGVLATTAYLSCPPETASTVAIAVMEKLGKQFQEPLATEFKTAKQWVETGDKYLEANLYREARKAYEQAIRLNHNLGPALFNKIIETFEKTAQFVGAPDLRERDIITGMALALEYGLGVNIFSEAEATLNMLPGIIIHQSPPPGTAMILGSKIEVVLSKRPSYI